MIGSLICYGLYPLTWFINRVAGKLQASITDMTIKSELLRNRPSSTFTDVEGTRDGGVRTRPLETQTALLDQWLGTGPAVAPQTGIETAGEGLEEEEGASGKEEEEERKGVASVVEPEEVVVEAVSEREKLQRRVMKEEGLGVQVREKADQQQEVQQETSVRSEELAMEEEVKETPVIFIEDESKSRGPTKELLISANDHVMMHNPSVADSGIEASASEETEICHHDRPKEEVGGVKESPTDTKTQLDEETHTKKTSSIKECWDDYRFEDVGERHPGTFGPPELDLASLLSEAQAEPRESRTKPRQPGWHFPVGPGLGEVVYCPSWQFPSMSYYPVLQETTPFEVAWRVWEEAGEPLQRAGADPPRAVFDFTVMSYNILAQDLLEANQELYVHCPLEVLVWDYRLQNLIQEFKKWEPDILCLQEVQEDHYEQHLRPALCDMGYTCVYKRRTGAKTDGCATCYRSGRFSQLSASLLEFLRPGCALLDRDNVGVVLLLRPVASRGSGAAAAQGPPLCVANTHLLFNPRRGDVKLAQLAIVLAEIDRLVKSCGTEGDSCNVVLCGDFNCVPNQALYRLITTGHLYYHGLPAWMVSGQEDMSYRTHHFRLLGPLWPDSLGINENCQFSRTEKQEEMTQEAGKLRYSHDFLLRLRYCEPACVRPRDLDVIAGVTDNTPNPEEKQPSAPRFRHTIGHGLDLRSVYGHHIPGTDHSEVTTLHSEVGATVDYIFYTAGGDRCGGDGEGLRLISRLSLPSEADLWSMKGLPNDVFPSDHLSLLARFQLELRPL